MVIEAENSFPLLIYMWRLKKLHAQKDELIKPTQHFSSEEEAESFFEKKKELVDRLQSFLGNRVEAIEGMEIYNYTRFQVENYFHAMLSEILDGIKETEANAVAFPSEELNNILFYVRDKPAFDFDEYKRFFDLSDGDFK